MRDKILLLEDEAICRLFMLHLLKQQNYDVDVAENGEDGVKKFRENYTEYSMVITDVGLPGISGIDAVKQMRLCEQQKGIAKNKQIPIVALSSHMSQRIHEACLCAGMQKTYTKPITPEQVTEVLKIMIPCTA